MECKPPVSGACCLPRVDGIIYITIGKPGFPVGMKGLDNIFRQSYLMGHRPEEASDTELVGMSRQFNYIPEKPAIEAEYGEKDG
jgi:hypothetical protein